MKGFIWQIFRDRGCPGPHLPSRLVNVGTLDVDADSTYHSAFFMGRFECSLLFSKISLFTAAYPGFSRSDSGVVGFKFCRLNPTKFNRFCNMHLRHTT